MQKLFMNIVASLLIIFSAFFVFINKAEADAKVDAICNYWIDGPIIKNISTTVPGYFEYAAESIKSFFSGQTNPDDIVANFVFYYDHTGTLINDRKVNLLILVDSWVYSSLGDGYKDLAPAEAPEWASAVLLEIPSESSFKNENGFSTCPVIGWKSKWDGKSDPQIEVLTKDKKTFTNGVVKATLVSEFSRTGTAISGVSLNCQNLKGDALTSCISYYSQNTTDDPISDGNAIKCDDFTYNGTNIINTLFSIIMIVGPILVIILGTTDLAKAALAADDQAMKKAWKNASKRLISAILLFLIPLILNIILGLAQTAGIFGELPANCIK